ncbi:MAG: TetR/AcrR family transcriptional regulator [Oscillospiraceae bacterium]|nr:TetR/AcrR family transcriptional regulator [Oscillospiraceae bacterium]
MSGRQDLRTARTQKHLRQALCELMLQKPINKITIRELTERAEVSRCTFYLYYDSIFGMVKSIENDMLSDYSDGLRTILRENVDSKKLISELVTFTFRHKYDNLPYSRLLYSSAGDQEFIRQYPKMIIEEFGRAFPGKLKPEMITIFNFYIAGITELLHEWIVNDIKVSPEEMSANVMNIIVSGNIFINIFDSCRSK